MKKKVICIDRGFNCHITVGFTYDVIREGSKTYTILNNKGEEWSYDKHLFEEEKSMTTDEKIALAESLIGKTVQYTGTKIKVTHWKLVKRGEFSSIKVQNNANKNGFCIAICDSSFSVPVEDVELLPDFKEIKLNDKYTAKVYGDKVEVGCQTFSKEKIEEIWKALNQ